MPWLSKQSIIALAGLLVLIPTGASAQALGTYLYSSGGTSGTMVVTDVSACQHQDSLGCMSATRPVKVKIQTVNRATASDCDLDATEETAARVRAGSKLEALLVIDDERSQGKPNLAITFDKAGAIVQPLAEGVDIRCGAGVGYAGHWRRKGR